MDRSGFELQVAKCIPDQLFRSAVFGNWWQSLGGRVCLWPQVARNFSLIRSGVIGVPRMIWAKRDFAHADFLPYQDRLEGLIRRDPRYLSQFVLLATNTEKAGVSTYWVGLPSETYFQAFEGFERVEETDLPTEIDRLCVGDAIGTARFRLKNRRQ